MWSLVGLDISDLGSFGYVWHILGWFLWVICKHHSMVWLYIFNILLFIFLSMNDGFSCTTYFFSYVLCSGGIPSDVDRINRIQAGILILRATYDPNNWNISLNMILLCFPYSAMMTR